MALTGGIIGATAPVCWGLTTSGMRQPAVEFIESSCGQERNMKDRILVA